MKWLDFKGETWTNENPCSEVKLGGSQELKLGVSEDGYWSNDATVTATDAPKTTWSMSSGALTITGGNGSDGGGGSGGNSADAGPYKYGRLTKDGWQIEYDSRPVRYTRSDPFQIQDGYWYVVKDKAIPRENPFNLDDRVKTPDGTGTICKVEEDDIYCVVLDSDPDGVYEFSLSEIEKV